MSHDTSRLTLYIIISLILILTLIDHIENNYILLLKFIDPTYLVTTFNLTINFLKIYSVECY